MTSDGTNTYEWDAENRLIKINYPGVQNTSAFGFDGQGNNVLIIETTSGVETDHKQFIYSGLKRREERDGNGSPSKKYYLYGAQNVATNFFYQNDHLGSVREVTDSSAVVQMQCSFDPFGREWKSLSLQNSDFQFAGYFLHSRSGLSLSQTRAYSSSQGRWISRDPMLEQGGLNLFRYVSNSPVAVPDESGMDSKGVVVEAGCVNCYGAASGDGRAISAGSNTTQRSFWRKMGWSCHPIDNFSECTCCDTSKYPFVISLFISAGGGPDPSTYKGPAMGHAFFAGPLGSQNGDSSAGDSGGGSGYWGVYGPAPLGTKPSEMSEGEVKKLGSEHYQKWCCCSSTPPIR